MSGFIFYVNTLSARLHKGVGVSLKTWRENWLGKIPQTKILDPLYPVPNVGIEKGIFLKHAFVQVFVRGITVMKKKLIIVCNCSGCP